MDPLEEHKGSGTNKFPKKERLSSKKLIEELFDKGSSSYLHPFRLFFKKDPLSEDQVLPQLLVTVPKRNFKKAVDRNRIRRQIKEAYRINKNNIFLDIVQMPPHIAIIYTAKEKLPFKLLEEKLILILKRLKNI